MLGDAFLHQLPHAFGNFLLKYRYHNFFAESGPEFFFFGQEVLRFFFIVNSGDGMIKTISSCIIKTLCSNGTSGDAAPCCDLSWMHSKSSIVMIILLSSGSLLWLQGTPGLLIHTMHTSMIMIMIIRTPIPMVMITPQLQAKVMHTLCKTYRLALRCLVSLAYFLTCWKPFYLICLLLFISSCYFSELLNVRSR